MMKESSPLWATMVVCFLSMAAAVSDNVTMTSNANCLCMLVKFVSAHSWGQNNGIGQQVQTDDTSLL